MMRGYEEEDFLGFLNDLQDWELSLKDKEMYSQASKAGKFKAGMFGEGRKLTRKSVKSDNSMKYATMPHIPNTFSIEESSLDATSEKDLGNEYFKQKKFEEAIECYSRSIVFSPSAVTYANRAMANLKLRRFQKAEDDCTEALNLDDRYIKAYSRRATARKELGKRKESLEDSEFALRLEPENQEIKKQYAEAKSLYEKETLQIASVAMKRSVEKMQKVRKSEAEVDVHGSHAVLSGSERKSIISIHDDKVRNIEVPVQASVSVRESRTEGQEDYSQISNSHNAKRKPGNQKLKASVQELASRAVSHAMAVAAKNIKPPSSAYEFEVSWGGLSGNRSLQANLLKATSASTLPRIFGNALSAPILLDIIKCIATIFIKEMDLAIQYLEHLTKIPRFDMLILFLSSSDKADLLGIWNDVFCNEATPVEYAEILDNLRGKYCLK